LSDGLGRRRMVLAHWHGSGRTLVAGRSIAQAYVEPNRIETGLEDDESFACLRDAALSEPDKCSADTLASGLRRDVETFDGVVRSMNPTDNRRVKQGNPDFVFRNGALHTRNTTAPSPVLRIARREVRDRELANSCDANVMQNRDIGAIGGPKLERWEHGGLTKQANRRTDARAKARTRDVRVERRVRRAEY